MRIYYESLTLPKKAAKRIQSFYSKEDSPFDPMQLSQAQAITSWMLGYESWHELEQETKKRAHPPSLTDEHCSLEEQEKRIFFQTKALGYFSPLIESQRKRLALKFRVSASNPKSKELWLQSYSNNRLELCVNDNPDEKIEWRFFPSERCTDAADILWDDIALFDNGRMALGPFMALMLKHLSDRPEDLRAMEWLLSLAVEHDYYDEVTSKLDAFEKVLIDTIPSDFPKSKKVYFEWYVHDNRPFHRAMYNLACCFYYKKEFTKAKKWFNLTSRTCEQLKSSCKAYLDDLKSKSPGKVDYRSVW